MTTLMIIILLMSALEFRYIMNKRDSLNDGILLSNLSASMVSAEKFVDSMDIIKYDNNAYDVKSMVETAIVEIDKDTALQEFIRLMDVNHKLYGDFHEVKNFTVYNCTKENVYVYTFENGVWNNKVQDFGKCFSPNGIAIYNTAVYAKVSIVLDGLIIKNRPVELENCVVLKLNEDLQ